LKIIAKDYINRSNLISGIVDLTQKNDNSLLINIVGIPALRTPTKLKQVSFRLIPEGMTLDIPELDSSDIESLYWWEHVEMQIDSETSSNATKWMSHSTFRRISEGWHRKDSMLDEYGITPDDILYTRSISNHGSYTITKEDLVILLGMRGRSTIRDSITSFGLPEDIILERILKALKYRLLAKSSFLKKTNYPETIRAMGIRINSYYSNLKSWFGNSKFPSHNYFVKELELLATKYPDAECLGINPDGIDVSESVLSLTFSKDPEFVSSVGAKILKPLCMLFSGLVVGSAYAYSVESANKVLVLTDRSLFTRYQKSSIENRPAFLRSFDE
jgi:hypothetical protein